MKLKYQVLILLLCISCAISCTMIQINSSSTGKSENSIKQSYEHLQCDYETREITKYHAPVLNSVNETWELFDAQTVSNMQEIAASFSYGDPRVSPTTIIGEDNRFFSPPISAPYSSIAFLAASFDNNGDGYADVTSYGTGFLVSKNVLITAAHCMIPRDPSSSTLIELKIFFDLNDYNFSGHSFEHPRRWTWSTNWHNEEIAWQYDYCVVELHNNISRPYYFNCIQSSNASTPQNIYASGYPGDHHFYQMTSYGQLTSTLYYSCNFNNDVVGGMSGGPLYGANCIGIITYESRTFNQGNLFTPDLYNLICSKISDNQ